MLACGSCGRAWNARVLDPRSLSTATCPGCGGELHVRPPTRRIAGQPAQGRFAKPAPGKKHLEERLTGLGG